MKISQVRVEKKNVAQESELDVVAFMAARLFCKGKKRGNGVKRLKIENKNWFLKTIWDVFCYFFKFNFFSSLKMAETCQCDPFKNKQQQEN